MALDRLKIDPEKTIIIGDGQNDLNLFNVPGYTVAVANAFKELKLIANEITAKPSAEGIIDLVTELKK